MRILAIALIVLFSNTSVWAKNLTVSCEFLSMSNNGDLISHKNQKSLELSDFDWRNFADNTNLDVNQPQFINLDHSESPYFLSINMGTKEYSKCCYAVRLKLLRKKKSGKLSQIDFKDFSVNTFYKGMLTTIDSLSKSGEGIKCTIEIL